jgi:hypothetical protein
MGRSRFSSTFYEETLRLVEKTRYFFLEPKSINQRDKVRSKRGPKRDYRWVVDARQSFIDRRLQPPQLAQHAFKDFDGLGSVRASGVAVHLRGGEKALIAGDVDLDLTVTDVPPSLASAEPDNGLRLFF